MSDLVDDIWLEIADMLPHAALANISLTNRRFRRLSKALLFANFDFHPYTLVTALGVTQPRLPHADARRMTERLEFWCSDPIALHLRGLRPGSRSLPSKVVDAEDWSSPIGNETPFILLEAFFQSLDRFKRLRALTLRVLDLHYPTLISSCPALELNHLAVEHCNVAGFIPGANLHVSKFSFVDHTAKTPVLALWLAGLGHVKLPLQGRGAAAAALWHRHVFMGCWNGVLHRL
ncbi:hypothetical protein C8F01DRAFT_1368417 [Mycena amicta]|nr:hypothetical protein C8F01DRAFT_1368417 [Mycena amicta]